MGAELSAEFSRLQLIVLLSALLASLTGLVSGERPVRPAQVELSAAVAIAQTGEATQVAPVRPASSTVVEFMLLCAAVVLAAALPLLSVRARLSRKMSWLN